MTRNLVLPNLIIPGGQKCGSSALAHCISLHPDCCLSIPKEPSFFSRQENLIDLSRYRSYFRNCAGQRILAEASTGYLFEEYAAARILYALGDRTKIIVILRRPDSRTLSAFMHQRKRFTDDRGLDEVFNDMPQDPNEAFAEEERRTADAIKTRRIDARRYQGRYDDYLWQFRYLQNSWYTRFLRAYLECFGRDNVLVVVLERLQSKPQKTMDRVFDFLDVRRIEHPAFKEKINPTVLPQGTGYFGRVQRPRLAFLYEKYPRFLGRWVGLAPVDLRVEEKQRLRVIRESLNALLAKQYAGLSELVGEDLERIWARDNAAQTK